MVQKKQINLIKELAVLLWVLSICLLIIIVNQNDETELLKENFKEYTIAINYINSAIQEQKIAEINYINYAIQEKKIAKINYNYLMDYVYSDDGYVYDYAFNYMGNSVEFLKESNQQLLKSRKKLEGSKLMDSELRIKQIDYLLELSKKRIRMIELFNDELYEINYGNEKQADIIYNKLGKVIDEFNVLIEESIDLDEEVDLYWGENFYTD